MPRRKTKYTLRADGLIELARVMPDGRRKHFYGHSDREVEQKYADALKSAQEASVGAVRKFCEVADDWWEKKEPTLSPNSVYGYITLKNRAVEEFGELRVNEITPQMIIVWLQRLAAQGYSQKVISNSKSVCKSILDDAFIKGELSGNPCVSLPEIKGKPKTKRHAAPEADIRVIERTKTDSLFARMSYFMEYTGCRRGEAAALQQKHIDLKHKRAYICQSIAFRYSRAPELKQPKTEAGTRYVDLYDNVIEILPHYDDPETFIFFPNGLPTKTQLESGLKKYQTDNGLSSTAHQLRHTYAGIGHSANVAPKDMQQRLGHTTLAMTEDVYTEVEDAHNAEVRKQINTYIKEKRLRTVVKPVVRRRKTIENT